jgi:hypothetical protein
MNLQIDLMQNLKMKFLGHMETLWKLIDNQWTNHSTNHEMVEVWS